MFSIAATIWLCLNEASGKNWINLQVQRQLRILQLLRLSSLVKLLQDKIAGAHLSSHHLQISFGRFNFNC